MEANELRIGNFVYLDNEVVEISGILEKGFYFGLRGYAANMLDWFQPIPLTEEWLLKFGFEKFMDCFTKKDIVLGKLTDAEFSFEGDYDACVTFKIPQYVHQLQNLYFCLTGEELTLKKE